MIGAAMLPDGRRLHLQHGPIDLVIEADADRDAVAAAYRAAAGRFDGLLESLVGELATLRAGLTPGAPTPTVAGPVAQRMMAASRAALDAAAAAPVQGACDNPVAERAEPFVTPMVAVAGSVADEVLAAMVAAAPLRRAYVNNGGDIALHLGPGESFTSGVVTRGDDPRAGAPHRVRISSEQPTRGIATSGWRGRSFSLGIADSVSVLSRNAATADAAATLIANETDVDSAAVSRSPARAIDEDSDLGDRVVTVSVGTLGRREIGVALEQGERLARHFVSQGVIDAALITLDGDTRLVDNPEQRLAA